VTAIFKQVLSCWNKIKEYKHDNTILIYTLGKIVRKVQEISYFSPNFAMFFLKVGELFTHFEKK